MKKFLLISCSIIALSFTVKASLQQENPSQIDDDGSTITSIKYNPEDWTQYGVVYVIQQQTNKAEYEAYQDILKHLNGEKIERISIDTSIDGVEFEGEEAPEYPGQDRGRLEEAALVEECYNALNCGLEPGDLSDGKLQMLATKMVEKNKDIASSICNTMKKDLDKKENFLKTGELHRIKIEDIKIGRKILSYLENELGT